MNFRPLKQKSSKLNFALDFQVSEVFEGYCHYRLFDLARFPVFFAYALFCVLSLFIKQIIAT